MSSDIVYEDRFRIGASEWSRQIAIVQYLNLQSVEKSVCLRENEKS